MAARQNAAIRPANGGSLIPFLSGFLSCDLGVSVGLISNHDPATAEIFQGLSCGLALRQRQQTTAFLGLSLAVFCIVHMAISFT
jgi:hypothetical protein